MDIWMRLNCPDIAEITGRRAIRQLGLHATAEDLVIIGTRIAETRVEVAYEKLLRQHKLQQRQSMYASPAGRQEGRAEVVQQATQHASQVVQNALQIVSALQEAFPALHPALLSDLLHATRLYICTYEAMIKGDWERALRLALRLTDATGSTAQSGVSPSPALRADISTGARTGKGLTVRQAQSLLLLARITFQFDEAEAKALLVRLETDAHRAGLVQYVTLACSLRAQVPELAHRAGQAQARNGLAGTGTARLGMSHALQAWRMDALLLTFNAAKLSKESGSALASDCGSEHLEDERPGSCPSYFDLQLVL